MDTSVDAKLQAFRKELLEKQQEQEAKTSALSERIDEIAEAVSEAKDEMKSEVQAVKGELTTELSSVASLIMGMEARFKTSQDEMKVLVQDSVRVLSKRSSESPSLRDTRQRAEETPAPNSM